MEVVVAEGAYLERILDASFATWGEGLSRRGYEQFNAAQRRTRWGGRHLQRFALVDGTEVLASAKSYSLAGRLNGRDVAITGLGAVFTPPEHRGHGYARALIERMLSRAAGDGASLALLFSEIGAEFYTRLGFVVVPRVTSTLAIDLSRVSRRGAPAVLVRSGIAADLPFIAEITAAMSKGCRFALSRPAEWIEYAIAKKRMLAALGPGTRHVQFFVVEEGGRAVAYAVIVTSPGGWLLEDCGDRDPAGARVGALLQALAAREPSLAPPAIRGWLPAGWVPPQLAVTAREPAAELMMVRPLAPSTPLDPPLGVEDAIYWHNDVF
jgi:GNAT superfamily N-acetyltransferase